MWRLTGLIFVWLEWTIGSSTVFLSPGACWTPFWCPSYKFGSLPVSGSLNVPVTERDILRWSSQHGWHSTFLQSSSLTAPTIAFPSALGHSFCGRSARILTSRICVRIKDDMFDHGLSDSIRVWGRTPREAGCSVQARRQPQRNTQPERDGIDLIGHWWELT